MEVNLKKLLENLAEIEKNKIKYKALPFHLGYYLCTLYTSKAVLGAFGKDEHLEKQIKDIESFDNIFEKLLNALDDFTDAKLKKLDRIEVEDELLLSAFGDLILFLKDLTSKYDISKQNNAHYKDLLILHEMFGDKEYLERANEIKKKMD